MLYLGALFLPTSAAIMSTCLLIKSGKVTPLLNRPSTQPASHPGFLEVDRSARLYFQRLVLLQSRRLEKSVDIARNEPLACKACLSSATFQNFRSTTAARGLRSDPNQHRIHGKPSLSSALSWPFLLWYSMKCKRRTNLQEHLTRQNDM